MIPPDAYIGFADCSQLTGKAQGDIFAAFYLAAPAAYFLLLWPRDSTGTAGFNRYTHAVACQATSGRQRAVFRYICELTTEPNMPTSQELYDAADKLKDQGKLDEAAAKLKEIVAIDPKYALAHSALAVVLGRLQRHDEAIQHGLKVCELEPNDAFSFTALSVTYVRAGKIMEAEDAKAKAHMLSGHRH